MWMCTAGWLYAGALTNRKRSLILWRSWMTCLRTLGYPKNINCDNEFNVKEVNEWAKKNNITMYYSQPYEVNKNAIVERFNRTLAQRQKNMIGTVSYLILFIIIIAITIQHWRAHHSRFLMGRSSMFKPVFKVENPFNVGDKVRTKNESNIFSKGDLLKNTIRPFTQWTALTGRRFI